MHATPPFPAPKLLDLTPFSLTSTTLQSRSCRYSQSPTCHRAFRSRAVHWAASSTSTSRPNQHPKAMIGHICSQDLHGPITLIGRLGNATQSCMKKDSVWLLVAHSSARWWPAHIQATWDRGAAKLLRPRMHMLKSHSTSRCLGGVPFSFCFVQRSWEVVCGGQMEYRPSYVVHSK